MSASLGRVTVRLAEPSEATGPDLIRLINDNVNPPDPVTEEEVYIRAMYVTSDQINSFGGCFPASEHARLAELLIDSPVMVGHRKDKLPIGRTFHGTVVERNGLSWVKAWFYWLKSAEGSRSLAENIDGGIYKECSVGFTFMMPECSICGKDIRRCNHEPFERYEVDGHQVVCHYNYRKLERVLETSLVYRGAAPGTRVTHELCLDNWTPPAPTELTNLEHLPDSEHYLVMPCYEGIEVSALSDDGRLKMSVPLHSQADTADQDDTTSDEVRGLLVGYRGKERRTVEELKAFLTNQTGPVTRIELKLYPSGNASSALESTTPENVSVRPVRYEVCDKDNLPQAAAALATREGVRIWLGDRVGDQPGYQVRMPAREKSERSYCLQFLINERVRLTMVERDRERSLIIRQFNKARLMKGARFVAEYCRNRHDEERMVAKPASGAILNLTRAEESFVMELTGVLCGRFALQPIRLHGQERMLFYRLTG